MRRPPLGRSNRAALFGRSKQSKESEPGVRLDKVLLIVSARFLLSFWRRLTLR
jgi:hypothetical protein